MPGQQQLFPDPPVEADSVSAEAPSRGHAAGEPGTAAGALAAGATGALGDESGLHHRLLDASTLWMQRVSLFILVLFCIYLGATLTYIPWWTAAWDHNSFFLAHPSLWAVLRLGVVRGLISGLGLLDIWIGISEAVHYRES